MRATIEHLVIEVTRQCQLECDHCLRGEQEELVIDTEYIEQIFSKTDCISTIAFSGGEPSLNPEVILMTIEIAKRSNGEIQNFYIATNTLDLQDKFFIAIIELYSYCTDNDASMVNYSNDIFHYTDHNNIRRLEAFKFTSKKYTSEHSQMKYLINEGRAKEYGIGIVDVKTNEIILYLSDPENPVISGDSVIYLNCEGNLINGCDLSYESQREMKNIICKSADFSVEAIKKYNQKYFPEAADVIK